jgi:hypothetical protein
MASVPDETAMVEEGRRLLLEGVDFGAQNESLAVEHAGNRGKEFVPKGAILRAEIQQGNLHRKESTTAGS